MKDWIKSLTALVLAASTMLSLTVPAFAQGDEPLTDSESIAETVPETETAPETTPEDSFQAGPEDSAVPAGPTLRTDEHFAYIFGSDNKFYPESNISRAEAAQILCRLLDRQVPISVSYSDVPADAWYAEAVGIIGSLGLIGAGQSFFLPDDPITRGGFIHAVASFFPASPLAAQFEDVSPTDPCAADYLTARASGWVTGFEDGTLRPEEPITRAQAVMILNRALDRTPDKDAIDGANPLLYQDVKSDIWYFYDVMEASISHQHRLDGGYEIWTDYTPVDTGMTTGYHLVDGWLYYYDREAGNVLRSTSKDGHTFDANGRFTSGSADLDARLRDIVMSRTNSGMTQEQKLRALYVYTRDSFTYLRRSPYEFGVLDFMEKDALNMLTTGYGNCYCYASVFWYLSRWIGYDAQIYNGTVGSDKRPHSWVEINFDGKDYIFDTELEMAYHQKGRTEINLYKYIDVDGWRYIK